MKTKLLVSSLMLAMLASPAFAGVPIPDEEEEYLCPKGEVVAGYTLNVRVPAQSRAGMAGFTEVVCVPEDFPDDDSDDDYQTYGGKTVN